MNVEAIEKVIVEMRVWAGSQAWPVESKVTNFAIQLEAALAEPEGEPLTEETPAGLYWWCDGKGGHWLPCAVNRASAIGFRVFDHDGHYWLNRSIGEMATLGGLVRPLVPQPGPVIPPPIQGERPVPVVVTRSDGVRFRAARIGDGFSWDENGIMKTHWGDLPSGYKWEVCKG